MNSVVNVTSKGEKLTAPDQKIASRKWLPFTSDRRVQKLSYWKTETREKNKIPKKKKKLGSSLDYTGQWKS